jgi:hypothetical protein
MATYSSQFVPTLLKAMHQSADLVGTDPMGTERSRYLQLVEVLALIAMTLKIIQDLHPTAVTDAALLDRLNACLDTGPGGDKSGWPGWILLQIPPQDLAMYGATETDSAAALQAKMDAYNSGVH